MTPASSKRQTLSINTPGLAYPNRQQFNKTLKDEPTKAIDGGFLSNDDRSQEAINRFDPLGTVSPSRDSKTGNEKQRKVIYFATGNFNSGSNRYGMMPATESSSRKRNGRTRNKYESFIGTDGFVSADDPSTQPASVR